MTSASQIGKFMSVIFPVMHLDVYCGLKTKKDCIRIRLTMSRMDLFSNQIKSNQIK